MVSSTSFPAGADYKDEDLLDLWLIAIAILYGPAILALFLSVTTISGRLSSFINDKAFQAKDCPQDPVEYATMLARKPLYFGIDPFILPDGLSHPSLNPRLDPGAFEDFIRYLLNEHSVLGMFFCDARHPIGRFSRAAAFCAINCSVLLVFAGAAIMSLQGNTVGYYMYQYLFMLPLQVFLSITFSQLLLGSCCTVRTPLWYCFHAASTTIVIFFALLGLLWIYLFFFLMASYDATKTEALGQIISYMYQIVIVGGATEALVLLRFFLTFARPMEIEKNVLCCKHHSWVEEKHKITEPLSEKANDAATAMEIKL